MSKKYKILAISGSTRKESVNHRYINIIREWLTQQCDVVLYEGLNNLPHFNPDLDTPAPPAEVVELRKLISEADGVLICTPEYAMGVPGSLKNALDWTVSSGEFSNKPVALVTAGTSGLKAHESLLGTLQVIQADVSADAQVVISFAKSKINEKNEITDVETSGKLQILIAAFVREIDAVKERPL